MGQNRPLVYFSDGDGDPKMVGWFYQFHGEMEAGPYPSQSAALTASQDESADS